MNERTDSHPHANRSARSSRQAGIDAATRRVLDALPQQIAILDGEGVVCFANRAWGDFVEQYRLGASHSLGADYVAACTVLAATDNAWDAFACAIRAILAGDLEEFSLEFPVRTDDRENWYIGHVSRFHGMRATGRVVVSYEDITQLKLAEAAASNLANFDPLTGLPNRLLLHDRLEQALAQARREGWRLGLLFIDLDRFKRINDTLGHDAGDQLLCGVTERLRGCVRRSDTVARLGGDEFVVVLVPLTRARDALRLARKILAALSAPFRVGAEEVYASASIGIALFPDNGTQAVSLLHCADLAMYRAKERGRNNCQLFTVEMDRQAARRLSVESLLRRALTRDGLQLHFQDQCRLSDGAVTGVETFLRVLGPDGDVLLPADFLAVAEESGLIVALGEWVLGEACRQLQRLQQGYGKPLRVAVNLSPREFRSPRLPAVIMRALTNAKLKPSQLELEITEKLLALDSSEDRLRLEKLKGLGVGIAIDDFGTGFSSINRLGHLPVDRLKIGYASTHAALVEDDARTIVRTIVAVAHNLGLGVVAEGGGTAQQRQLLQTFNCDEVQGWLATWPVEANEMLALLAQARGAG